jgi:hypothetical protein
LEQSVRLDRLAPNLRIEGIEIKSLGRDPVRRVQILEITKTYSAEEIEAEAANAVAITKAKEEQAAARQALVYTTHDTKVTECAKWLKELLASGGMLRKDVYQNADNRIVGPGDHRFNKDIVNLRDAGNQDA